jgi:hypothetical protein
MIIGNYLGIGAYVSSGSVDTNSQGQQAFLVVGDSIMRGSNNASGPGPTPTSGTVYQWNNSLGQITEIGASDVYNVVASGGTFMPRFGIDYNTATGYKPVMISCGSSGSNFSPDGDNNNWSATGTLRASTEPQVTDCLNELGVSKLKAIIVGLGINDVNAAEIAEPIATALTDVDSFFTWLTTTYPGVPILVSLFGRNTNSGVSGVVTTRGYALRNRILENVRNNDNIHVVFQQASWVGSGGYGTVGVDDQLHPVQSGNNNMGTSIARWFSLSSYAKPVRSILSCFYDDLSTARKNLINDFITTIDTDYYQLENLHLGKNTIKNNVFVDLTHRATIFDTSGGFTANDSISSGTSSYWNLCFRTNLTSIMTQTDCFTSVRVKSNTTPSGTVGYLLGAIQTAGYRLGQVSTPALAYAVNDGTLSTNNTHTAFQNNTVYGLARNGGTKYILTGTGTTLASAAVASTGTVAREPKLGALDNAGAVGNTLAASYEYVVTGKYSTIDYSRLITALNTLVSSW